MSNRLFSSCRGSCNSCSVREVRGSLAQGRGGPGTSTGANFVGGLAIFGKVVLKRNKTSRVWGTKPGVIGVMGGWLGRFE